MMIARHIAVLLALLGAACIPRVDYGNTEYQCLDGITCPPGFDCVNKQCVRRVNQADGLAGGQDAQPDGPPDGSTGGAVDGPLDGSIDGSIGSPDAPVVPPEMVVVPAGSFYMGCNPSNPIGAYCPDDTTPMHRVTLSAFLIDETEVTQRAYDECDRDPNSKCETPHGALSDYNPANRPEWPVANVTWDMARIYCEYRNKRLPTEAEWEMAARGTDGRMWPWGNDSPDCSRARYFKCEGGADSRPTNVKSHNGDASPYGAREMAGNAAEWVADWYGEYEGSPGHDPQGPGSGTMKIVRGGSYRSNPGETRSILRMPLDASTAEPAFGFRCARSLPAGSFTYSSISP